MNFYKLYNLIENQNFFKNFSFIDKIITQTHAKEIYNLLLGMFPEAKQIIDYQYNKCSLKTNIPIFPPDKSHLLFFSLNNACSKFDLTIKQTQA